ncbi:7-dehydrosterol-delta 7-reductase [Blastomyces gilchristii SLH14081]|uniref:7-dehydrocholesterol reductase n=1 Tax=Blastomyces gilchristii (strain SLH14081) TaxID=559298 RepID=A0A179UPF9_BLAGS|nr:7-dehydrosterol-delta 7-reductase [Blastomyces gilchristii SLH14081]OAT08292.1 7-dehydrosterol-delta 7-reductase [Blastomyces gilchristii SLH14081]
MKEIISSSPPCHSDQKGYNLQRISKDVIPSWGRRSDVPPLRSALSLAIMLACPAAIVFWYVTLQHFDGSLLSATVALRNEGFIYFYREYCPIPNLPTTLVYGAWVLFQALLYSFLPGSTHEGQPTPAGNILKYKINGLLAAVVTTLLFGAISLWGGTSASSFVAANWGAFLAIFNIYGLFLTLAFYIKAHISPSHPEDRKFSGSPLYDIYMGIELNPRLGQSWDMKLFHNGRPGIIGWILIDMSFTALQFCRHGYITNSILIADILHLTYIMDFFFNEDWYLKTIDMAHDHVGFYLAWGSAAWLPTIYTLQPQFLAINPVSLSPIAAATILTAGFGGYVLFRSANHQKYLVRDTQGKCLIWGKAPEYIQGEYKTADGSRHKSIILCSGWWGVVRHANYLGDLILSYAMCATCGFTHLLPWTYAIFMTTILVHRCYRDEERCAKKYGKTWGEYCGKVRWRIIPGVF